MEHSGGSVVTPTNDAHAERAASMPTPLFSLLLAALSVGAAFLFALSLARQRRAAAREARRRQEAQARAQAADLHRRTLDAVTDGRLRLCEAHEVAALLQGERLWSLPLLDAPDVSRFRTQLRDVAARRGFTPPRLDDLCSCVTEAAANAVRHCGGGVAQVWATDDGLTILVSDCGKGIAPSALFGEGEEGGGLGFRLMLAMADALALCTNAEGTQLVLTVCNHPAAELKREAVEEETTGEEGEMVWAA